MSESQIIYKGADMVFEWSSYIDEDKTIEKPLFDYINIYFWVFTEPSDIKKFSLNTATGHTLVTETGTNTLKFVVDGSVTKTMKAGAVHLIIRTEEPDLDQADNVYEDEEELITYNLKESIIKSLA